MLKLNNILTNFENLGKVSPAKIKKEKIMNVFEERLGKALRENGFITLDQLNQAREQVECESKRLIDVLQEQRFITRETLVTVLSFQFKMPVVNLRQININPKALELVPEKFAREHEVLPIGFSIKEELQLVTEDPCNFGVFCIVAETTKKSVTPLLAVDVSIREILDIVYAK